MKKQSRNKKRIILGLTGSFGTGKSTVAGIFKARGVKIIDADEIAHRVIRPKTKIYEKMISAFGQDILDKDKAVNRNKLARIVFENKDLLKRLNKLIHPQVIRIIKEKIKSARAEIIIIDAPLLIEAGLHKIADKLIVVKTNSQIQIKRVKDKFSLAPEEIKKRIRCQIPLKEKIRVADFVIDNSKTLKNTKKQVEKIRRLLWKK